jgi:aspartate aminotransferase
VVAEVLGDPVLEAEWRTECKVMADRIIAMRQALRDGLAAAGSTKDWSHVTSQIGSERRPPPCPCPCPCPCSFASRLAHVAIRCPRVRATHAPMAVFCYTGLSKDEVSRLKEEYHIYITADGRISMAGITSANVEYVSNAIHAVAS